MPSFHKFFVSPFFFNPTPMRAALCKLLVEALMHVNVCCQIIVNTQNFIYIRHFPAFVDLYQVNVSTVKHSSCAMVLSFYRKIEFQYLHVWHCWFQKFTILHINTKYQQKASISIILLLKFLVDLISH